MKSLDETKRALECCFQYECCLGCPYHKPEKNTSQCIKDNGIDALFHLMRLEALVSKLDSLEDDLK